MTPYYQDDKITIYHGDAIEVLSGMDGESVHAVVTDPPYVIGAVSSGSMGSKSGGWADMMNSSLWFTAWYREVGRILKHDGSFWSFLNWRTLPVVVKAAMDARLPITSMMVWDKQWIGPGGSQGLRPAYEMCALMAGEGFAVKDRGVPDIWQHKVGSYKGTGHPAEKPVGLVGRILDVASVGQGQVVVDPFVGSGTTLVAAQDRGIKAVGIEAEERYCEMAASRISQQAFDLGGAA